MTDGRLQADDDQTPAESNVFVHPQGLSVAVAVSLGTLVGSTSLSGAAQSDLRTLLKAGMTERAVIREYEPVDLAQLTGRSDAIVRLRIATARSVEIPEAPNIVTEYRTEILDTVLDRTALRLIPGRELSFTRDGGELVIDQERFMASESGFPQFLAGDEYLLFMHWDSYRQGLAIVGGGQGAFRIDGNLMAHQTTHIEGDTPDERPSLDQPLEQLRSLIEQILASRK